MPDTIGALSFATIAESHTWVAARDGQGRFSNTVDTAPASAPFGKYWEEDTPATPDVEVFGDGTIIVNTGTGAGTIIHNDPDGGDRYPLAEAIRQAQTIHNESAAAGGVNSTTPVIGIHGRIFAFTSEGNRGITLGGGQGSSDRTASWGDATANPSGMKLCIRGLTPDAQVYAISLEDKLDGSTQQAGVADFRMVDVAIEAQNNGGGASALFASRGSVYGRLECHRVRFLKWEGSTAHSGYGVKWDTRLHAIGGPIEFHDCDFAPALEHAMYIDSPQGHLYVHNCRTRGSSRTSLQVDSRTWDDDDMDNRTRTVLWITQPIDGPQSETGVPQQYIQPGSGYQVGDTLELQSQTVDGVAYTVTEPTQLTVTAVGAGGALRGVSVSDGGQGAGDWGVWETSPGNSDSRRHQIAVTTITGAGSGAQVSCGFGGHPYENERRTEVERKRYLQGAVITPGTTTGAPSGTLLVDSGATFQTDGVEVGLTVRNDTDGSEATVVSVDSETQLTTTALSGGTDDTWATGDSYTYGSNTKTPRYPAWGKVWVHNCDFRQAYRDGGGNVTVAGFLGDVVITDTSVTYPDPADVVGAQPTVSELAQTMAIYPDNADNHGAHVYTPASAAWPAAPAYAVRSLVLDNFTSDPCPHDALSITGVERVRIGEFDIQTNGLRSHFEFENPWGPAFIFGSGSGGSHTNGQIAVVNGSVARNTSYDYYIANDIFVGNADGQWNGNVGVQGDTIVDPRFPQTGPGGVLDPDPGIKFFVTFPRPISAYPGWNGQPGKMKFTTIANQIATDANIDNTFNPVGGGTTTPWDGPVTDTTPDRGPTARRKTLDPSTPVITVEVSGGSTGLEVDLPPSIAQTTETEAQLWEERMVRALEVSSMPQVTGTEAREKLKAMCQFLLDLATRMHKLKK